MAAHGCWGDVGAGQTRPPRTIGKAKPTHGTNIMADEPASLTSGFSLQTRSARWNMAAKGKGSESP
eukprot:10564138-Prorocentrum_lima.AAC.1